MTQFIQSEQELKALFDDVAPASLRKETAVITPHYQKLIEASPFAMLATSGSGGLDASPRGDAPGFVQVQDRHTLLLPERRGNNRIDGLRNLIEDPRVALLFLIPGLGETLRVNGKARISVQPELLERFAVEGKPPKCVLVIHVEAAFFQCARAILRSGLWDAKRWPDVSTLPSPGKILAALTDNEIDGGKYDDELPARQRSTLY